MQSTAFLISSEISAKLAGVFSPDMLAEVDTIGLPNFFTRSRQNPPSGILIPTVPSSATVLDANAYFECELTDPELLKDKGICLCKVLNVYVKEELFDDESQSFVPGCLNTLHHVSGGSFSTSGEIV